MTKKLLIGIRGFGIGKLLDWDVKCTGTGIGGIVTITDVMNAVNILIPSLQPQVLIDFRVAILNYQHHPVTTMNECMAISLNAAQRPFEPVHSDDMEFLREHHTVFFNTVRYTSYNNDPSMYNHGGCLQHEGACGGKYRLVEKCPKASCEWLPIALMIGKVPILLMRSVVEYLGQGTIHNNYIQLSQ